MKPTPLIKRIVLVLVVVGFVAAAFAPLAVKAGEAETTAPASLTVSETPGVWVPAGVLQQMRAPDGEASQLTTVTRECSQGVAQVSVSHVRAAPGHSADAAILAVMKQEGEKAAQMLDFHLEVNGLPGAPMTRLTQSNQRASAALQGPHDATNELATLYPRIAAACHKLASTDADVDKQFERLAQVLNGTLPMEGMSAIVQTADAQAARALFEQVVSRALAARDASFEAYTRAYEDGRTTSQEVLLWTSASREVRVSLSQRGGLWYVEADQYSVGAAAPKG